nr:hypothetical protein GCM10025732_49360 [Glycomyces mayteni]
MGFELLEQVGREEAQGDAAVEAAQVELEDEAVAVPADPGAAVAAADLGGAEFGHHGAEDFAEDEGAVVLALAAAFGRAQDHDLDRVEVGASGDGGLGRDRVGDGVPGVVAGLGAPHADVDFGGADLPAEVGHAADEVGLVPAAEVGLSGTAEQVDELRFGDPMCAEHPVPCQSIRSRGRGPDARPATAVRVALPEIPGREVRVGSCPILCGKTRSSAY